MSIKSFVPRLHFHPSRKHRDPVADCPQPETQWRPAGDPRALPAVNPSRVRHCDGWAYLPEARK